MSQIHSQAETALAYLGEHADESQTGMDFMIQDAQVLPMGGGDRPSVVGLGTGNTSISTADCNRPRPPTPLPLRHLGHREEYVCSQCADRSRRLMMVLKKCVLCRQ